MKRKYLNILLGAVCAVATSCTDKLDQLPDNRMVLRTPDDVSKLLVTAYPDGHPAYLLEMYSDNTDELDNPTWTALDAFQEQAYKWQDITEVADGGTPQSLWERHYKAVATANEAIKHIEGVSNKDDYSTQLGEALLCRAFSMFQLANTFCHAYTPDRASTALGLPYPEKPEDRVGVRYERGTLGELYAHIDSDLQRGLALVSSNYLKPKFHFNVNAANAFAARFYLYYQKYDKAVEYATKVLGDNPANKLRDWESWNKIDANRDLQPNAYIRSTEKANLLLLISTTNWGAVVGPYAAAQRFNSGELLSKTETLQANGPWGSSDDMNYVVWFNNSLSKYMIRKIPYIPEYSDRKAGIGTPHTEISVFNTDETLMVRAEANALLGNYTEALADINAELSKFSKNKTQLTLAQIRSFYSGISYYTPTSPTPKKRFHTTFTIESNTQEPLLQCILQLRRLLTINDGLRMQDIKRYGITIYRRTINTRNQVEAVTDSMTVSDPRLAVQLPQDVISSGLPANPRN